MSVAMQPRARGIRAARSIAYAPVRRTRREVFGQWVRDVLWWLNKVAKQGLSVLAHPSDAFWDLKRTGDWLAIPILLLLVITARMLTLALTNFQYVFSKPGQLELGTTEFNLEQALNWASQSATLGMTNFFYDSSPERVSVILEFVRILIPFGTWCLAHYAVASIFFGEGKFKDVVVAASFCFMPYILFSWPITALMTNITTLKEKDVYFTATFAVGFWAAYLYFVQIRTIHDFSNKQTWSCWIISLITVILIWALFIVLFVLTSQVTEFFRDVIYELFTSGQTVGDVLRSPFVRFALVTILALTFVTVATLTAKKPSEDDFEEEEL